MQLRLFSLLPFVALVALVLSTAPQVQAWNEGTVRLEKHVESMNKNIGTLYAAFTAYLGGDLTKTGIAVDALGALTTDLHNATNDLSDEVGIKIQGEDVKDIIAGLRTAWTEVSKVVQALIRAKDNLVSTGNDGFISQFLPDLARAFNGFSTAVAFQADKKYVDELVEVTTAIVAWQNLALVQFNIGRISADWLDSFGLPPCDNWSAGQKCKNWQKRDVLQVRADRM